MIHKRLPAEKRRSIIIRAAIDEFSESNFRVAKVSDIATRAGVTDPMIYKFFKSKEDLFLEILTITSRKTLNDFLAPNDVTSENINDKADIKNILEKSILNYLESMETYRKEIKIYFQAISEIDLPNVKKVLRDAYQSYADYYQSMFKIGIKKKILAKDFKADAISWDIIGFAIHQSTLFLMGFYNEQEAKNKLSQRVNSWVP